MFQVGLLRCVSAIVYCSDKRESVRALLGNGFVIRRTCSFIQSFAFFQGTGFPYKSRLCNCLPNRSISRSEVLCCAEYTGYWTCSLGFVFASLASSSSPQPTVPSNVENSRLHILKPCLRLPSRSVHRIDRLFIKGGGGVRWRRGESRAEWQVVGKRWVSHWLTRWKLNTGPRLVSQQESACCLGAGAQVIGHAGTLHLPNPRLIYMDFLRLILDLRDARVLLI